MVMMHRVAIMMPGRMPAANSWPMEASAMMPYRIMGVLGGIKTPRVPPMAMEPVDSLSS